MPYIPLGLVLCGSIVVGNRQYSYPLFKGFFRFTTQIGEKIHQMEV